MLRLLRRAAYDQRITPSQLQAFNILASFSGQDCSCFASTSTIAGLRGISRQAAQKALKHVEELGYFQSIRRYRQNGSETSKLFIFNQDLAGVDACLWFPKRSPFEAFQPVTGLGAQLSKVAQGASSERCGPPHLSEDAQRNQLEETSKEETPGASTFAASSGGHGSNRHSLSPKESAASGQVGYRISGTSMAGGTKPARMQGQVHRSLTSWPSPTLASTRKDSQYRKATATERAEAWDQRQHNKALDRINRDLACEQGAMEAVFETLHGETYSAALNAAVEAEMKRPGNGARYLIAAAKNAHGSTKKG